MMLCATKSAAEDILWRSIERAIVLVADYVEHWTITKTEKQ